MSEPGATPTSRDATVGSVSEEAAKLFGALSDWARDHGSDLGQGAVRAGRRRRAARGARRRRAPRHRRAGVHLLPDLPHRARRAPDQPGGARPPGDGGVVAAPGRGRAAGHRRARTSARPDGGPGSSTSTSTPTMRHDPTGTTTGARRDGPRRTTMTLACGIDVGGTKIAGGVVDEDGTILEELRVESPATDAEAIEEAIAGLVTELRSRHPIETVGVGAAGYVDKARAVVLFAPNVAWRNEDLKGELEKRVELPGRDRERRQRRGVGRVPLRRRRTTSTTCCWSPSAPASAAGWCSTARSTAAPTASAPRSATCASCPTASSAAAASTAASSSTPAARPWCARRGPRRVSGALIARGLLDRAGGDLEADHRPADHRGGAATATRAPSSSWPSSAAGSARASRR